jgi:hypothetical protein
MNPDNPNVFAVPDNTTHILRTERNGNYRPARRIDPAHLELLDTHETILNTDTRDMIKI